jgi:uncharacterized membrane protein
MSPRGDGARKRVQRAGRVEVTVDAPIDAVWAVLSDVTRTGEWSHECRSAAWARGATAAAPGVRFRERNRSGRIQWTRTNELFDVRPPVGIGWRTVQTLLYRDVTEWRFRLRGEGERTTIVQEFRIVQLPAVLDWLYARALPPHRNRDAALTDDLYRLGEVARSRAPSPQPPA